MGLCTVAVALAKVRNVGYLTYDDRFFYAGFEFDNRMGR